VIHTCSYRLWTPELGAPVRTSLGSPRWFTAPLLELPVAYPWGLLRKPRLAPEEFTERYLARLDARADRVLADVLELEQGYGDVVLCCFEAADQFCHRRILAGWLAEHLGVDIPELPP